jgi:hypothetical protein
MDNLSKRDDGYHQSVFKLYFGKKCVLIRHNTNLSTNVSISAQLWFFFGIDDDWSQ